MNAFCVFLVLCLERRFAKQQWETSGKFVKLGFCPTLNTKIPFFYYFEYCLKIILSVWSFAEFVGRQKKMITRNIIVKLIFLLHKMPEFLKNWTLMLSLVKPELKRNSYRKQTAKIWQKRKIIKKCTVGLLLQKLHRKVS